MADRVELIEATYIGTWELPASGCHSPSAVLIRPDGYVAWVGDLTQRGSPTLTTGSDRLMRRSAHSFQGLSSNQDPDGFRRTTNDDRNSAKGPLMWRD